MNSRNQALTSFRNSISLQFSGAFSELSLSGVRYYIDDHKRGAFDLGAPTTDVLDVTGRPAEDFETIARRYAALPRNQRSFGNWVREFAQFMLAPLGPGFNFDRYDRELRRPFPSRPQFAPESKVWRREHAINL